MRIWHPFAILMIVMSAHMAVPASAQVQDSKTYRVAYLAPSSELVHLARSLMLPALSKLGFKEGRNLVFDSRIERQAGMGAAAASLVRADPHVIVTIGPSATLAAKSASDRVPIVMFSDDPVGYGLADSLANPRGNVTGVAHMTIELHGKRLEILHDALPLARRIGLLLRAPEGWAEREKERAVRTSAAERGLDVDVFWAENPDGVRSALLQMKAAGIQAALIGSFPGFAAEAEFIAAEARRARIPIMCPWPDAVRQGCLLGYGATREIIFAKLAYYVGRILRGVEIAELPIERPIQFELGVNLEIAREMSLSLPHTFISRADEVIE